MAGTEHLESTLGRWAEAERLALDTASGVAGSEGRVSISALAAATGMDYPRVWNAVDRLRKRREWPYRPMEAMQPPPAPEEEELREILREYLELTREHTAGMLDGRREIDDPVEHGVCAVPCSGRDHAPRGPSLRRVCRRFYREWRAIRDGVGVASCPGGVA